MILKDFTRSLIVMMACTMCSLAASAQMSVTFTLNDNKGETVPYATVYIYNASDTVKVIASGVTDDDGRFDQVLNQAGKYKVKATFVGMDAAQAPFEVSEAQPRADLGTLVMGTSGLALKGIEVTAQRQLVKTEIDRIGYDIQADADSKTNTTLEMLKKVPLVSVDGQEEIRVKGSTSFKIYRNGHPDPSLGSNAKDVLKAIPASMIKRIEVITDPGAKYDAEGTSAILNIVMMENSSIKGATGTVSAGVDNYGGLNGGLNITTQISKVVANLNYGYARQPESRSNNLNESLTTYGDSGNELSSLTTSRAGVNIHYGDLSASWEPDTLNLLSLSAGGFYYDASGNGSNELMMRDASGNPIYGYKSRNYSPGVSFYDIHGRADFEHKTGLKDETLTLSYMLSTTRNKNDITSEYYDIVGSAFPYTGTYTKSNNKFAEHTFQFDWTRPFAKYYKLETGVKYIYRLNNSDNTNTYTGYSAMDNHRLFDHTTHVGAGYASVNYSRDKWTARAGLRYEFSHLQAEYPDGSGERYHRNLSDWVPNASVQFQPNWANSFKLSFSSSIERPGISYLNPAVTEAPTSRSFGNANLESARIYDINFTYMRMGPKLTFNLSPSFAWSDNRIVGVQYLEDGKQVSTYENAMQGKTWALSAFVQWTIGPKTSFMFNGNVNYQIAKSDRLNLENDRAGAFVYANLTQTLPWKLRLNVGGGAWMGGLQGLYGYSNGNGFYNLSLQRSFLKEDRLTVALHANNFASGKYSSYKSYTTQGDYTGWSKGRFVGRTFGIRLSYRFGSLKASVKHTNTTIENNDVVGGGQQGGSSNQGQGQN